MGWFACSWCLVSGWAGLAGWDGRVGLRVASVLALTGLSPPPSIQTAADSATVSQPPGTDSYSELQKESARNRGFERNLPDDPLPTSHSPPPPPAQTWVGVWCQSMRAGEEGRSPAATPSAAPVEPPADLSEPAGRRGGGEVAPVLSRPGGGDEPAGEASGMRRQKVHNTAKMNGATRGRRLMAKWQRRVVCKLDRVVCICLAVKTSNGPSTTAPPRPCVSFAFVRFAQGKVCCSFPEKINLMKFKNDHQIPMIV